MGIAGDEEDLARAVQSGEFSRATSGPFICGMMTSVTSRSIGARTFGPGGALRTVRRAEDFVAVSREHRADQFADDFLVLDDQDRLAVRRLTERSGRRGRGLDRRAGARQVNA